MERTDEKEKPDTQKDENMLTMNVKVTMYLKVFTTGEVRKMTTKTMR